MKIFAEYIHAIPERILKILEGILNDFTDWLDRGWCEMLRRIIDQQMADTLGITGPSTSNAFLTEPQDTEIEAEKDEALFMVWGSGWSSRSFHLIKFLDVGSDFHDLRP